LGEFVRIADEVDVGAGENVEAEVVEARGDAVAARDGGAGARADLEHGARGKRVELHQEIFPALKIRIAPRGVGERIVADERRAVGEVEAQGERATEDFLGGGDPFVETGVGGGGAEAEGDVGAGGAAEAGEREREGLRGVGEEDFDTRDLLR
jgi:hypothetical protein